jgi:hypothetical protein
VLFLLQNFNLRRPAEVDGVGAVLNVLTVIEIRSSSKIEDPELIIRRKLYYVRYFCIQSYQD